MTRGTKRPSIGLTTGAFGAVQDFRNRQLGKAGEQWVFEAEREGLDRHGRRDLADSVVWVANDLGDGAGYDIASFHSMARLATSRSRRRTSVRARRST